MSESIIDDILRNSESEENKSKEYQRKKQEKENLLFLRKKVFDENAPVIYEKLKNNIINSCGQQCTNEFNYRSLTYVNVNSKSRLFRKKI
jgi:restriction endonuclease S subunit